MKRAATKNVRPAGPASRFPKWSHQWLDALDLDMARQIAKKIRRQPALYQNALDTLQHWKEIKKPAPLALREWDRIIKRNPVGRVLEILTQDNDEGQRLRQSDPFCGILTERERLRCFEKYEEI